MYEVSSSDIEFAANNVDSTMFYRPADKQLKLLKIYNGMSYLHVEEIVKF